MPRQDPGRMKEWEQGKCSLIEATKGDKVRTMLEKQTLYSHLSKYSNNICNKLHEIRRDVNDTSNYVIPEKMSSVLPSAHVDYLTQRVRQEMAKGGPYPNPNPQEEQMILANADILPVEVARSLDPKKRKNLLNQLKGLREASEAKSYPTVPYEGDDEAFIKENLLLVPRKLAEFLTKEDRRGLVELLRVRRSTITFSPRSKEDRTLLETLPHKGTALLLFPEQTRGLFRGGSFFNEAMKDPKWDLQFFKKAEEDGYFKVVPKEVFDELDQDQRRKLGEQIENTPDTELKKAVVMDLKDRNRNDGLYIDECLDVIPLEAVVYLKFSLRLNVANRIRKRQMVTAANAQIDQNVEVGQNDLLPEWIAGLLMPEERCEVVEKLKKLKDGTATLEDLVSDAKKACALKAEEAAALKRKSDSLEDSEIKEKHRRMDDPYLPPNSVEVRNLLSAQCGMADWRNGTCSLLETMHRGQIRQMLEQQSSSSGLKPYVERIWFKLCEMRIKEDSSNYIIPEEFSFILDLNKLANLTTIVRKQIAKGEEPLYDPEEEKMILANADIMPVEVARVYDAEKRKGLIDRVLASRKLPQAVRYPTVPYEGDDEEFIMENLKLVPRHVAEFLTKKDRRELVDLVRLNPLNLKERSFIETMRQNQQLELFSSETCQLFHMNLRPNLKHEVGSDPKLDLMFYREAEEDGCFKIVPKEVFDELMKNERRSLAQGIQASPDPEVKKAIMVEHKKAKKKEAWHIDESLDVIPLEAVVYLSHKQRPHVANRIRRRRMVAAANAKLGDEAALDDGHLLPAWVAGLLMPEERCKVVEKLMELKKMRELEDKKREEERAKKLEEEKELNDSKMEEEVKSLCFPKPIPAEANPEME